MSLRFQVEIYKKKSIIKIGYITHIKELEAAKLQKFFSYDEHYDIAKMSVFCFQESAAITVESDFETLNNHGKIIA